MKNKPIGIFDSGIGGLTVAKAIQDLMPQEHFIYFGDTAHLPYGEKSGAAILAYSKKITEFLISKGCKAIIIACNSASSVAFEPLKKLYGNQLPIISVIEPVVMSLKNSPQKKIGILGTKATIGSKIYSNYIKKLTPQHLCYEKATPLFAQMIEENFASKNVSNAIIEEYLSDEHLKNTDTIILGCTHYPLIHDEIADYYLLEKEIIDSPQIVAHEVKRHLEERNILADQEHESSHFYVSLYTKSFEQSAKIFFKQTIHFEEYDLWEDLK